MLSDFLKLAAIVTPGCLGTLLTATAVAQDFADKVYTGGKILTIDDAAPRAEAVAILNGRIIAVGDRSAAAFSSLTI